MNEQIAKLANESGFDVDKTGAFGNYSEMHRLEKLVDSIINECADKILNHQPRYLTRGQAQEIADSLKEHFGVK